MQKLPGMEIETGAVPPEQILHSMFISGGLYLSQVCTVTGVEQHTVQNWVKRGFVSPPVGKRYSESQLCRIAMVNMLRCVLPLNTALNLLRYINGVPGDESDDRISDSVLYLKFCRLVFSERPTDSDSAAIGRLTADLADELTRKRTGVVLRAMYCVWRSAEYKRNAEEIIFSAEVKGV